MKTLQVMGCFNKYKGACKLLCDDHTVLFQLLIIIPNLDLHTTQLLYNLMYFFYYRGYG